MFARRLLPGLALALAACAPAPSALSDRPADSVAEPLAAPPFAVAAPLAEPPIAARPSPGVLPVEAQGGLLDVDRRPLGHRGGSLLDSGTTVAPAASIYADTDPVIVNFGGMSGAAHDWVSIALDGAGAGSYVRWVYLSGRTDGSVVFPALPAGTYRARAYFNDTISISAESDPAFTVTQTLAAPTVTVPAGSYETGGSIVASWANMAGFPHDYVALARDGAPANKYLAFVYTGSARSGNVTFGNLPLGTLVVRAFFNDASMAQAESAPFTVAAPATPSVSVATTAATYTDADPIVVTWSGMAGNAHDWVSVVQAAAPATSYLRWVYTAGQLAGRVTFPALPAGSYVARAYFNDGSTVQAESAFTVTGNAPTVTITTDASSYAASATITVNFSGLPGYPQDFITIAAAETLPTKNWTWAYTGGKRSFGSMTFVNHFNGTAVARAFAQGSYTVLAESARFKLGTGFDKPSKMVAWWAGDGTLADRTGLWMNAADFDVFLGDNDLYASPGEVADAFNFDGFGDWVAYKELLPKALAFATGPFTVEAWVRFGDASQRNEIVDIYQDSAVSWFSFYQDGGALHLSLNDGQTASSANASQPFAFAADTWYHVAAVRSGTSVTFYVDGASIGASTVAQLDVSGDPEDPNLDLFAFLGMDALETGTFTNGSIDELSLYSRALAGVEILQIYLAGSEGKNTKQ